MLFDVEILIAFLSQGTTLEAGSIIMTGTPEGESSRRSALMNHRGRLCDERTTIFEAE